MTDLEKLEQVRSNWLAATCFFLIGTATYTLLFCRFTSGVTVNSFSSVNHMNWTNLWGYFHRSCLVHTRQAILFASVRSWACFFFKHFSCSSLWIIRCTEVREIPVSRDTWRIILWVPGQSSWLNTSVSTEATLFIVRAVQSLPPPHMLFCWSGSINFGSQSTQGCNKPASVRKFLQKPFGSVMFFFS